MKQEITPWKEAILTYIKRLFYKALNQDEKVEELFESVAIQTSPYYYFYLDLFEKKIVEEDEEEENTST